MEWGGEKQSAVEVGTECSGGGYRNRVQWKYVYIYLRLSQAGTGLLLSTQQQPDLSSSFWLRLQPNNGERG